MIIEVPEHALIVLKSLLAEMENIQKRQSLIVGPKIDSSLLESYALSAGDSIINIEQLLFRLEYLDIYHLNLNYPCGMSLQEMVGIRNSICTSLANLVELHYSSQDLDLFYKIIVNPYHDPGNIKAKEYVDTRVIPLQKLLEDIITQIEYPVAVSPITP